MRRRAVLLLWCVPLLLPTTSWGQEQVPAKVFADAVSVEVVNVDVMVTDKRGHPITGLGPEAFRVFEDGQEVPITNFLEVEGGRLKQAGDAEGLDDEDDGPEVTMADPLPEERVNIVVYVDLPFLRHSGMKRTVREVQRFFDKRWTDGNRAMLAVSTGMLHVAVPFTEDPNEIIEGLEALRSTAPHGDIADAERISIENLRAMAADEGGDMAMLMTALLEFQEMAADAEEQARAERSMESLRAMVDQLAVGPPGRRALLLVSDGLPPLATRRDIDQLIDHANANRVSIYTLYSQGDPAYTSPVLSAEVHGRVGYADPWGHRNRSFERGQDSLGTVGLMAWRTGGRVLYTINGSTMRQLAGDFSSYYSIGYQPPTPGDGRSHTIEVRVDEPRAVVRHRMEYRSFERRDRIAGAAISALVAAQSDNPLGVDFEIGEQAAQAQGGFAVPITVRLPAQSVTVVPKGDGQTLVGAIRLYLVALHGNDQLTPLRDVLLPIELPASAAAEARDLIRQEEIVLPRGRATIAVTAVDEAADIVSSIAHYVDVGKDGSVRQLPSPFAETASGQAR